MVWNKVNVLTASLVIAGTLAAPALILAQESVSVQCAPGQRAVMEQQRVNGRTLVPAISASPNCQPRRGTPGSPQ